MWLEFRERWGRAITDEEGPNEVVVKKHPEKCQWERGKWNYRKNDWRRRVATPTWGCARAGTVEARVKRVKHVENEEETSEGASNDVVVASLGRAVGGHAREGGSDSNFPWLSGAEKISWREKVRLRLGDVAWRPVTREGWKPTVKPRSKRERIYGQKAGEERSVKLLLVWVAVAP